MYCFLPVDWFRTTQKAEVSCRLLYPLLEMHLSFLRGAGDGIIHVCLVSAVPTEPHYQSQRGSVVLRSAGDSFQSLGYHS